MFERGGRLSSRPTRFLARRGGSLWSAFELRVGQVEDIELLQQRLVTWTSWGQAAPAPWLGEMQFEASGHRFTVFDRTVGLVPLPSGLSLAPEAGAWLGERRAEALQHAPEPDCPLALFVDAEARVHVRPLLLEPDPWADDQVDPWGDLPRGQGSHQAFAEALAPWLPSAIDDARRAVQVATALLDGVDPEGLPSALVQRLLDDRESPHAWAVAHDWLLSQRLPRAELVLLEQANAPEAEVEALRERYVELGLGALPAGVSVEWRLGYVWAIDLVPMGSGALRALLEHPSCRFVHTLRLKVNHFVDAVELLGDLVALGHDAVRVIDAPPSVFTAESNALRRAFPRLR